MKCTDCGKRLTTTLGDTVIHIEILCPNLSSYLNGKEASYENLYASFAEYCNKNDEQIDLCGLSLGGILALNYASDFPNKAKTFILGNSMKTLSFSNRLHSISCPTLIVCGKKDGVNMRSAIYLAENIENAELKILDNTGHVVNEENPKVLAEELAGFYCRSKE